MKILKVVGIVAGIHALALLVIFANPGCSSSKGQSTPPDAPAKSDASAPVAVPANNPAPAPVAAADASVPSAILYSPTRPGTPAATALEVQPVAGVTPATTYTVVGGDNLSTIAKKHHLKASELAAANSLRAGATLHVGQKLVIPSKADSGASASSAAAAGPAASAAPPPAAPAAAGPAKPAGESIKHIVKSGETLGAIARKYGVRVGDIATANAISDPQKIHPGQELIIPGGSIRAPKSAAPKAAKPGPASAATAAPPETPPPAPAPAAAGAATPAAGDVPVIKIDDAPPAPAPKP